MVLRHTRFIKPRPIRFLKPIGLLKTQQCLPRTAAWIVVEILFAALAALKPEHNVPQKDWNTIELKKRRLLA